MQADMATYFLDSGQYRNITARARVRSPDADPIYRHVIEPALTRKSNRPPQSVPAFTVVSVQHGDFCIVGKTDLTTRGIARARARARASDANPID